MAHNLEDTTIDLAGLPAPVVRSIKQLVESLRAASAPEGNASPVQRSIIGLFADQGIQTPPIDEFEAARHEMSATIPRKLPLE